MLDWGQNSYGAANPNDPANWQKPLSYYCQDNSIDVIPIAFLNKFFSVGGDPEINLANVRLQRVCAPAYRWFTVTNFTQCRLATTKTMLPSQALTLPTAPILALISPSVNPKERSLLFLWVVLVAVLVSKGKDTVNIPSCHIWKCN